VLEFILDRPTVDRRDEDVAMEADPANPGDGLVERGDLGTGES
jgi:hypothetical protein